MSARKARESAPKICYNEDDESDDNESAGDVDDDDSEDEGTTTKKRPRASNSKVKVPNKRKKNENVQIKKKPRNSIPDDEDSENKSESEAEMDSDSSPPQKKTMRKSVQRKPKIEDDDDDDDDDDGDDNDEDDDGEDADNDEDEVPKIERKKRASSSGKSSIKNSKAQKVKSDPDKASVIPKTKKMGKLERLEEARQAFKWWEAEELPDGVNWRKLEHTGIVFPPPYVRHNVPLLYDGKPIHSLTKAQEELITFYAAMPDDGPQLGNPKTRTVFQNNFFADLKEILPPGHEIKKFEKCDFTRIREHLAIQKELRKAATQEEKLTKKADKESELEKQGFALIDGRLEKMGNFRMEPPGLFRGRGEHPKTGCLKARQAAESVTLNLSADSCVPICDVPGHAWQAVKHDSAVTWLCTWQENVQNQYKYVMLAASSSFKGKSDMEKYSKAILLTKHIEKVRKDYTKKIKSQDAATKQLGTAMWVIDKLALRVGGEKGEDEADTVGCCSLRVEHLSFNPDPNSYEIELEFLGKDSMLYKQNINYGVYGDLGKLVYNNLKSFCKKKNKDKDVFDNLTPQILNKHLTSLMPGLTAKVFRTFNASITLEKELPTIEELEGLSVQEKVGRYNAANRSVAILCNHQKTVSKATEIMFENLNERLEILKSQRDDLIKWKELVRKGKSSQIPLKKADKDVTDAISSQVKEANLAKEAARTMEEKLNATAAVDEAKRHLKEDQKRRMTEKHMFKIGNDPSQDDIERRITRWNEDIRKLEVDIRNRDENKDVALGTSKINYMDPRISVAWCKRCEVPIDKIFAKTLRDKFNWAMAVPPDWKFE
mmetsp:Transcript_10338/g.10407  ORF Transcript_10338/g.10407 Transcript_10338/m.10407 type:complete len:829 (+) Transcript_10338:118-2604(+)|eukprot:CAMPEP_0182423428 /NCGR_PEP_ID=MMETSP1167-20130531/9411_1 /TAXON_ID=2988 /ORGANISM="Mallomonas Sp, Strain CCMP3275" /LENGTH=828 /DNA_ID=CAMNT_0024602393 /DNA_START=63 /DNA_END=2552 /DNA_ORIENTATION=-